MTRSDFDWPFVRQNMLVPAVTAILAVLALIAAYWVHAEQVRQYSRLSGSHAAIHEDYDALVLRRRLVDLYHRRYLQFHDLGFVGRESRLDWIESLRTTTEELTLPRVSYAIEPQVMAIAPVQAMSSGDNVQIYRSSMRVEMGLVHELDLLRLIDELQGRAPGLIKVDNCELDWQVDEERRLQAGANIQASCGLKIYSLITSDVAAEDTI